MMSEFAAASLLALAWKSSFRFVQVVASLLALSFVFASDCHTQELDAASFWFESSAAALPALLQDLNFDWMLWASAACYSLRNQVQRRLRLCHNSFFSFSFLHHFRHCLRAAGRAEIANVEHMEKMVRFIRCEIALGQYVSEFVFGVDVFDLDFGIEIYSIKQPVKCNSVSPGHVSHCWTSALYDHLDHRFIVFKNEMHRTRVRRLHVYFLLRFLVWLTSITKSQRSSAGVPSMC